MTDVTTYRRARQGISAAGLVYGATQLRPYVERPLRNAYNSYMSQRSIPSTQHSTNIETARSRQNAARDSRVNAARVRGAPVSFGQIAASGGGESKSQTIWMNPMPKVPKGLGTNNTVRSSGYSSASTQGVQNAQFIGAYFTAGDIYNAFNVTSGVTAPLSGVKLFFGEINAETLITNAENTNAHFTLYDVIAKVDGQATHNIEPANCFLVSGIDASGGGAGNATIPGTDFFFNPRLKAYYKLVKKTKVILGPGDTHSHVVKYGLNKFVSQERIRSLTVTNGNYPVGGISMYTVMIHHGTPVHDETTETSVTLGKSKLDVVLMESMRYKYIQQSFATNDIATSLGTGLTGEQMIIGVATETKDDS